MEIDINRSKLREILGKHLSEDTSYSEMNPETIKELLKSGVIDETLAKIRTLPNGNANWCFACGASKSAGPESIINPADWSEEKIDNLAKDLLGIVEAGTK